MDDETPVGHVVARRDVLGLFATAAGAAVVAAQVPRPLARAFRFLGSASPVEAQTLPSCIVRPALTEGPYFVDEKLNRSDIRSDPGDGSVKPGVRLALAFNVSRLDGASCTPFAGVLVDVWHCDALGVYSDVADPGFDTVGQKFLRGYQVTDASGVASFVSIYPGWYQGRTVHLHFKIRTDPAAATALEFTSQLFFDDELTDIVHAQQPYATKGQRTLRNDGDGIYRDGGSQLLLTLGDDGAGGYVGTFDIGIQASGTSTVCASIADCLADLENALPDPASAASRKAKRTARTLERRTARVASILDRAATSGGTRQAKLYGRARAKLEAILAASQTAAGKGTLGVMLGPLAAAIAGLLGQLPA